MKQIISNNKMVIIIGKIGEGPYKDGKGYYDENGTVWIYSTKAKSGESLPYFWVIAGHTIFTNPTQEVLKEFNISNAKDPISTEHIDSVTTGDEELYDKNIVNTVNTSSTSIVLTVEESDDFLKKLVKTIIINAEMNLQRYKDKLQTKYAFANLITSLRSKSDVTKQGETITDRSKRCKLSTRNFSICSEIFGFDFVIIADSNGTNAMDKLKEPVVYVSRKDRCMTMTEYKELLKEEGKEDGEFI